MWGYTQVPKLKESGLHGKQIINSSICSKVHPSCIYMFTSAASQWKCCIGQFALLCKIPQSSKVYIDGKLCCLHQGPSTLCIFFISVGVNLHCFHFLNFMSNLFALASIFFSFSALFVFVASCEKH